MTARDLLTATLRLIGVVASGETPTAAELNDGLVTLNTFISYLQTQGRTVYTFTRVTKAIVASQASYTIGAAGEINRARPLQITKASVLLTSPDPDLEIPLRILAEDEWRDLSTKPLTGTLPTELYYNPTYPLGTIHLWPIGTDITVSLVLYLEEPVGTLATLDTVLSYPPGYERMLKYKMAVELAPEYQRQLDPVVVQTAAEAWAGVKRSTYRPQLLRVDAALLGGGGRYNIRTDGGT